MIAYLATWLAGVSIALGAIVLLAITHTSNAPWMLPFRAPAERIARTMPLFALAFLPVAFGLGAVYPWVRDPGAFHEVAAVHHGWLSRGPFLVRSAIVLVTWSVLAELVVRRKASAIALPLILVTATIASFDWILALDPAWVSTAFGLLFLCAAFSGGTATTLLFSRDVPAESRRALSNLLLTGIILWGYVFFGQFLIHWIGDEPKDITWYLVRTHRPWIAVAIAMGALHLAVPFFLLLPRAIKRARGAVTAIAAMVLLGHVCDVMFLVLPGRLR